MLSLKTVQERVSSLFYHHGLLCASHPFAIISLDITIVMLMCYPLINMPLPGNAPLQFVTPVDGYKIPPLLSLSDVPETAADTRTPRWYFGVPVGYIQQVIVRTAVDTNHSVSSDALLKAALSTVFDVIEHVENYQLHNGSDVQSLSDVCLHVTELTADWTQLLSLLPQYNCLQLSPARFWNHDRSRFMSDASVVRTVSLQLDMLPLFKDILFGVPWKRVGLEPASRHGRAHVVTYAVTVVFREYHHSFVTGLRDHLQSLSSVSSTAAVNESEMTHVHYRRHNYIVEYTPLMLAYIVLCLYLYFSVRKIEMVKSKWGLALSAMITVFASLLMSVSLCVFFGLTPSLNGSEIFPYLVIVIGLENVLVVTKSVVSTPVHLEVKLRVAQGLQKEGWYIFRNLMTELLVLAVGFFTFVPAIQEFCLFAVLGLGSDFFLQMFFFTTVLSIDIRRMELSDLQSSEVQAAMRRDSHQLHATDSQSSTTDLHQCPVMSRLYMSVDSDREVSHVGMKRLPPADELMYNNATCDDVFYVENNDNCQRRHRHKHLIHAWAQYRLAQRGIMLCVVVWILLLVYKTGLVEEIDDLGPVSNGADNQRRSDDSSWTVKDADENHEALWKNLSPNHWPTLFAFYNMSLTGRYLTVLPCIQLTLDSAVPVVGDVSSTRPAGVNQTSLLAIILSRLVRSPRTNMELLLTILLAIASIILAVNGLLTMCSRNYAVWRSYWQSKRRVRRRRRGYYTEFRETVPLVLSGHKQDVECIVFDGQYIASSCLAGEIRVWDSTTGECLTTIDRSLHVSEEPVTSACSPLTAMSSDLSDVKRGVDVNDSCQQSSRHRSVADMMPDLSETIDTDFLHVTRDKLSPRSHNGFDFTHFQMYFDKHRAEDQLYEQRRHNDDAVTGTDERLTSVEPTRRRCQPIGSSIWSLACADDIIIAGCHNGSIELWDATTGQLQGCYQDCKAGVVSLSAYRQHRIIAARVNGMIDFLQLLTPTSHGGAHLSWGRVGGLSQVMSSLTDDCSVYHTEYYYRLSAHLILLSSVCAHQQAINVMRYLGDYVVTASNDHTLKVYRVDDAVCLYTLHGHSAAVSALALYQSGRVAISGSDDCSVRVWDVKSGCCRHKLTGHSATVTHLCLTASHVVSVAIDDRLCIWHTDSGSLQHCIQLETGHCNTVTVLTRHIIATGGQGCVYVWDVDHGGLLRVVSLSARHHADQSQFVRQLHVSDADSSSPVVVADYGCQLRLVRFTSVLEKDD